MPEQSREQLSVPDIKVLVVGDTTALKAKAAIEKGLAAWTKAGDKASFNYPKLPELQPAKI